MKKDVGKNTLIPIYIAMMDNYNKKLLKYGDAIFFST